MAFVVRLRKGSKDGDVFGTLGPFPSQELALAQAQVMADQAAPNIVVTIEPAKKPVKHRKKAAPVSHQANPSKRKPAVKKNPAEIRAKWTIASALKAFHAGKHPQSTTEAGRKAIAKAHEKYVQELMDHARWVKTGVRRNPGVKAAASAAGKIAKKAAAKAAPAAKKAAAKALEEAAKKLRANRKKGKR